MKRLGDLLVPLLRQLQLDLHSDSKLSDEERATERQRERDELDRRLADAERRRQRARRGGFKVR